MPAVPTITEEGPAWAERLRRAVAPLAAFAAGAAPVALLGFSRGGYPVEVVAGYGIALWWLLTVGFLTGALPRPRPTRTGLVALGALVALVAWAGLSLTWSENDERGLTEIVRLIVALGSLLLGMSAVRAGQSRALAGGVLAGLCTIVGMSVLTRLQPDLIPAAGETASVLRGTVTRLSWPLNYWNAIAAAAAIAIPLGVVLGARARSRWTSAFAVAPIPVLALGTAFTLSRGGIVAAVLGIVAALVLVAPRPVVLRTLVAPAVGTAVLLLDALRRAPLTDVVGGTAQSDAGASVIVVATVVTLGVFAAQAGLVFLDRTGRIRTLPRASPRASAAAAGALVVVLLLAAVAFEAPGRVSDRWDDFTAPRVTASRSTENSAERLGSISSNGRHEMWSAAVDALEGEKLGGLGIGSWEGWWTPRRGETGFVRNAHSEVFELLAETGLLGALLFAVVLLAPFAGGLTAARRRGGTGDAVLGLPAFAAFVVAVAIDWSWQLAAVMVAGVTLAAPALAVADTDAVVLTPPSPAGLGAQNETGNGPGPSGTGHPLGRPRLRPRLVPVAGGAATLVAGVVAMGVMAVALVAPQAVDDSRDAVADGDLERGIAAATRGVDAATFASSPALQRALIQEQSGELGPAEASARLAAARAPTDWRPWFLVARIAAARGDDRGAVVAYRTARRMNPRSSLLMP